MRLKAIWLGFGAIIVLLAASTIAFADDDIDNVRVVNKVKAKITNIPDVNVVGVVPVTGTVDANISGPIDANVSGTVNANIVSPNPLVVAGAVDANVIGSVDVSGSTVDVNGPVPVTLDAPITVNPTGSFQYIGNTFTPVPTNIGIDGMHTICQSDLQNSAARMCTSEEVFKTVNLPTLGSTDAAWVQPVITAAYLLEGNSRPFRYVDIGGAEIGSKATTANCASWSIVSNNFYGAVVRTDSVGNISISGSSCGVTQKVACCAPQ